MDDLDHSKSVSSSVNFLHFFCCFCIFKKRTLMWAFFEVFYFLTGKETYISDLHVATECHCKTLEIWFTNGHFQVSCLLTNRSLPVFPLT